MIFQILNILFALIFHIDGMSMHRPYTLVQFHLLAIDLVHESVGFQSICSQETHAVLEYVDVIFVVCLAFVVHFYLEHLFEIGMGSRTTILLTEFHFSFSSAVFDQIVVLSCLLLELFAILVYMVSVKLYQQALELSRICISMRRHFSFVANVCHQSL